ncbi:MAG: hypothetical protein CM15mP74_02820 [Halieaceae bacterium]|nr:MAG: hypothetical protein CM15mP74_02820 [Halieaceae bacterium]
MVKKMASRMRAQMRHSFLPRFGRLRDGPFLHRSGCQAGCCSTSCRAGLALRCHRNRFGIRHSRIVGVVTYDCGDTTDWHSGDFSSQGLYRSVIRYMGQQAVWDLVKAVSLSTMTLGAAIFFTKTNLSGTAALVFWLLLLVGVGGLRLISRAWHQASVHADARGSLFMEREIRGASYSTRSTMQLIIVLWLLSMIIPTCMRR